MTIAPAIHLTICTGLVKRKGSIKAPVQCIAFGTDGARSCQVLWHNSTAGCEGDSLKTESFGRQRSTCTNTRIRDPPSEAAARTEAPPGSNVATCLGCCLSDGICLKSSAAVPWQAYNSFQVCPCLHSLAQNQGWAASVSLYRCVSRIDPLIGSEELSTVQDNVWAYAGLGLALGVALMAARI